jgi:hypothetical protein
MLTAALAIPVSGAAVVGLTGPASAGAPKPPKVTIVCTSITGSASSTVTVSGCTGGNTGGSSKPVPATALAAGGTIDWVSGATTTISAPTLTSTSAKHCPGYSKTNTSSQNPSADKFAATVTGGSDVNTPPNMPLSGTAKGEVCIAPNGSITAPKPTKIKGRS